MTVSLRQSTYDGGLETLEKQMQGLLDMKSSKNLLCLSQLIHIQIIVQSGYHFLSRDVEAIDCFQLGGWDSYKYLNCKVEAKAEAEAMEAA